MKVLELLDFKEEIVNLIYILEKDLFGDSSYTFKTIEDMILSEEYKIFISGNDVKGYLIIHNSFDVYEIMKIGVQKEERNKGIGKDLIRYYLENYTKNLFLEVRESNENAQKFYENIGFKAVGKRKNYYSNGETAILMLLETN